jgi:hypothetical protein
MFRKLWSKLRSLTDEYEVDPSGFNDPVALKTEWTPAKPGGASFRTRHLAVVDFHRAVFRASLRAILFYGIFLLIGIAVIVVFLGARFFVSDATPNSNSLFLLLFGLVFATVGGWMLRNGTLSIVFDRDSGRFRKGRKIDTALGEIHAIQLISENCSDSDSSFYSYELNLVLQDGKRIHVVDHGDKKKLREDAQQLSEFLGKPVWDGILD